MPQRERDYKRMIEDTEAHGHDLFVMRQVFEKDPPKARKCPLWHTSEAKTILKEDIEAGVHKQKTPMQMCHDPNGPAYRQFPLKVFRKHIHQEVDDKAKKAHRFDKKKTRSKFRETAQNQESLVILEAQKKRQASTSPPETLPPATASFSEQFRRAKEAAKKKRNK